MMCYVFFSCPQGFAVTDYVDNLKYSHIVVREVLHDGLAFSKGTFACAVIAFIGCNYLEMLEKPF